MITGVTRDTHGQRVSLLIGRGQGGYRKTSGGLPVPRALYSPAQLLHPSRSFLSVRSTVQKRKKDPLAPLRETQRIPAFQMLSSWSAQIERSARGGPRWQRGTLSEKGQTFQVRGVLARDWQIPSRCEEYCQIPTRPRGVLPDPF